MAQTNNNITAANADSLLEARPTQRLGNQKIEADGDTWQETLAVCEAPPPTANNKKKKSNEAASGNITGKLIIRSYFQNTRSGKRVWDEPPSGASHILPASEEMRRMAELQLAELQIVTAPETPTTNGGGAAATSTEKKKRRGFFAFGSRRDKQDPAPKTPNSNTKIRYKPGSSLLANRQNNASTGHIAGDNDAHLQEAIARSLAESQGIPYQPGSTGIAGTSSFPDDEELAMAKALSLSAAHEMGETEEQLLARVLEESKIEDAIKRGTYQAAMSEPEENDLLGMHSVSSTTPAVGYYEDDRKMPATATLKSAPIPTASTSTNYPAAVSFQPTSPIPLYATATAMAPTTSPMRSPMLPYPLQTNIAAVAPSPTSPKSPVSPLFDPYSKDAPSAASRVIREEEADDRFFDPGTKEASSSLQKMDPNRQSSASARLSFGRRSTTNKKIQDKAGLV